MDVRILSLEFIIIVSLIALIVFLVQTSKSIQVEKRISRFALVSLTDSDTSLFDRIFKSMWRIIYRFSNTLDKNKLLKKYGLSFEKYITYEERQSRAGSDYVAIKFLLTFFLLFLNVISNLLQYGNVNWLNNIILVIIGFFIVDIVLKIQFHKRKYHIQDDLLKAIIMMNNAFKSGRNIIQAIEIVSEQLNGPISDEFKKIYSDIKYGLSLEVAFSRFYERVELVDAKYITSSLTLVNKTGGNIIKIFSSIEKHFINKTKLRNELKSLTASSILMYRFLAILPFVFTVVIFSLNPTYFTPFLDSIFGVFLLIITITLYILYILIVKRIMKVNI